MTTTGTGRDTSVPVTQALVRRALALDYRQAPAWVRELSVQCMLDWFAVTLAGARDPLVRLLLDEAREEGGKPGASVIGWDTQVTRAQAALINGTASHVLDYDDVNLNINGHPSAVLVPAVLALGESIDASGEAVLGAFLAGYEFACRAGRLVAPGHYLRGYHATSTVGGLGAALACARLLGLDADRTAHAVGIAATQAAGLKGMFGTECKPFHAGMAAQSAVRAAALAARGMGSRADALECRQGFAAVMSPDFSPEAALGSPDTFYIGENLFKYHAACYGTHSAIECARSLAQAHRLAPEAIEQVTVRVERGADAVCNIAEPRTGLEAKFSLRFTTAMALAGRDTSDLGVYNEQTAADPVLVALRDKVTVQLVSDWPAMQAGVQVRLRDGQQIETECDAGIPNADRADQGRRLHEKFSRLVEPALGKASAKELEQCLDRFGEMPVRAIMHAARGSGS